MKKPTVALLTAGLTATLVFGGGAASAFANEVELVIDGVPTQVRTYGTTVGDVLNKNKIEFNQRDYLSPSADTKLTQGISIEINYIRPVTVRHDGVTVKLWTMASTPTQVVQKLGLDTDGAVFSVDPTASIGREGLSFSVVTPKNFTYTVDGETYTEKLALETVQDLLAAKQITLGAEDRVLPSLDARLTSGMEIKIQRVTSEEISVTEEVAYSTSSTEDSSMDKGTSKEVTAGKNGVADNTYTVIKVDGIEESRNLITSNVTQAPVNREVVVGTKVTVPIVMPKSDIQAYAREQVLARGWSESDFSCLVSLWDRESGWNPNAYNPSSGAGGIPQALPASKMASAGADWATNPQTQVNWGLGYIAGRYGTPCGAWNSFLSQGWY